MLDFGVNPVAPVRQQEGQQVRAEIVFKVNERVIMNYDSAKRLATTLLRLIRQHQHHFGQLELDVAKRRRSGV